MMKTAQKTIVDALKRAEQASLEEQDRYRAILELDSKYDNPEIKREFIAGGWKVLQEAMSDCRYPPVTEFRRQFLNVEWDQELSRLKLEKITDKDVRFTTYFLNEIVEQTQRLHSMAKFIERVGTVHGDACLIFEFWSQWSQLQLLHIEAMELGMEEEAKRIQRVAESFAETVDVLLQLVTDDKESPQPMTCNSE